MNLNRHIRKHIVMLACLMAISIAGVYVMRMIHAIQVEQAYANGDTSHNADDCQICHFTLAAATEPEAQTTDTPIIVGEESVAGEVVEVVVAPIVAAVLRGPPSLVLL